MGTLKRLVSTLTILGGMVLVSTTANAGLVTFEYRGEVTAFSQRTIDTLPFTANLGDEVVAIFEFDTSVPDAEDLDPTFGDFPGSVDYTLFIGSTRLETFDADLSIENDRGIPGTPANDRIEINGGSTFFESNPLDFSFSFLISTVNSFVTPRPSPLGLVSSDQLFPALQSLDLQALDLAGDDIARGSAGRVDRDGIVFQVEFSVDSVSQPVRVLSEPSTFLLMLLGAGLGFVGLRMDRRRSRHSACPQHV